MNTGINVVIMGVPNAGKSSLFNKIIGYDRTIVSSEEGTTRDSIETKFIINQYRKTRYIDMMHLGAFQLLIDANLIPRMFRTYDDKTKSKSTGQTSHHNAQR